MQLRVMSDASLDVAFFGFRGEARLPSLACSRAGYEIREKNKGSTARRFELKPSGRWPLPCLGSITQPDGLGDGKLLDLRPEIPYPWASSARTFGRSYLLRLLIAATATAATLRAL